MASCELALTAFHGAFSIQEVAGCLCVLFVLKLEAPTFSPVAALGTSL